MPPLFTKVEARNDEEIFKENDVDEQIFGSYLRSIIYNFSPRFAYPLPPLHHPLYYAPYRVHSPDPSYPPLIRGETTLPPPLQKAVPFHSPLPRGRWRGSLGGSSSQAK